MIEKFTQSGEDEETFSEGDGGSRQRAWRREDAGLPQDVAEGEDTR